MLQINEAFHRRQRRFEFARFGHDLDDLTEAFDVDLALLGDDAAIGLEIERQGLAGDLFGRAGGVEDNAHDLIANGRIAHDWATSGL